MSFHVTLANKNQIHIPEKRNEKVLKAVPLIHHLVLLYLLLIVSFFILIFVFDPISFIIYLQNYIIITSWKHISTLIQYMFHCCITLTDVTFALQSIKKKTIFRFSFVVLLPFRNLATLERLRAYLHCIFSTFQSFLLYG